MRLFVVKILYETAYLTSCSVEVFNSFEKAQKFSKAEIASYAKDYEGEVTEENSTYFTMKSTNACVTIEIVKKEIM